jgi:uncharacterized repeat protein (TIGR03803 family)
MKNAAKSGSAQPMNGPWLCGQPPSVRPRQGIRRFYGELPAANTYKSLYKFKAGADGGYPYGALLPFNGKLYGTTDQGGAGGYGTVFELSFNGQERVVYSFKGGSDGAYPCAGLVQVHGKFYGTTQSGGAKGWGAIFDVTPSGQEHVIYSFKAGHDGAAPYAGLLSYNGKLYGTTVEGGATGWGTIFATSESGPAHVIYSFKAGKKDGGYPYGKLVELNGKLYGTTMQGGSTGWGTLFSVTTTGTERLVYSFKAGNDGGYPFGGVTPLNGKLYGTTKFGGKSGYGIVFSATTSGQERVLYSFKGNTDGAYPYDGLFYLNGVLFGTTVFGGSSANWGTIFRVDTSGKESVLYRFKAGHDGAYPFAQPIAVNGKLYGTTQGGGTNGGWGTAFTITP